MPRYYLLSQETTAFSFTADSDEQALEMAGQPGDIHDDVFMGKEEIVDSECIALKKDLPLKDGVTNQDLTLKSFYDLNVNHKDHISKDSIGIALELRKEDITETCERFHLTVPDDKHHRNILKALVTILNEDVNFQDLLRQAMLNEVLKRE